MNPKQLIAKLPRGVISTSRAAGLMMVTERRSAAAPSPVHAMRHRRVARPGERAERRGARYRNELPWRPSQLKQGSGIGSLAAVAPHEALDAVSGRMGTTHGRLCRCETGGKGHAITCH